MMRNNITADKSCQKHWKEDRQTRSALGFGFLCPKTSPRGRPSRNKQILSVESLKGSEIRSKGQERELKKWLN